MMPLPDGEVEMEDDGVLTFVGYVLAEIPIGVHHTKLILYGFAFGVLEDCIIIGNVI